MPQFKIAWTELYGFERLVEADTLDDAIELFKSGEIVYPSVNDALYIDGTTELNVNFTNECNDPVTGVKEIYK